MEERTYGRRSVGRSDVITKPNFLALMGLPKSLINGAPRAELRYNYCRVISLINLINSRESSTEQLSEDRLQPLGLILK